MSEQAVRVARQFEVDELICCDCCGRQIRKVYEMRTGHCLGSECALWLSIPLSRHGRKPSHKLATFARSLGISC
jgi:hypothetical protein